MQRRKMVLWKNDLATASIETSASHQIRNVHLAVTRLLKAISESRLIPNYALSSEEYESLLGPESSDDMGWTIQIAQQSLGNLLVKCLEAVGSASSQESGASVGSEIDSAPRGQSSTATDGDVTEASLKERKIAGSGMMSTRGSEELQSG